MPREGRDLSAAQVSAGVRATYDFCHYGSCAQPPLFINPMNFVGAPSCGL